ncbi:MAG TPA: anti-sigma regulatory factor [Terriglobales bacterium]|nr:anti-sigma regulatory factor [Terriglobales bacterium]
MPVRSGGDVVLARQRVRSWAADIGFNLVDQTKLVTAASELARNMLDYGGGGEVKLEEVANGVRRGLRVTFEDQGPGIPDVEVALRDGYTTGEGLGMGLGGAKRLVNEFEIDSRVGQGTRVVITRWRI